jgi:hypothetical protein
MALLTAPLENRRNISRERHVTGRWRRRLGGWPCGRDEKRGQQRAEKPKQSS